MKDFFKTFSVSLIIIFTALFATFVTPTVFAQTTATATFQVTATVSSTCTIAASNVAFGPITPSITGVSSSTGTLTSTCTKTTPYSLSLNAGAGTFAQRTMLGTTGGNTDKLNYNLYTTIGASTIFGDGTNSTSNILLTGTGGTQTTTVYGQLSLNQYIKPDTYSDTLTVTLAY